MNTENFWRRVKNQIKAHKISQVKFLEYINIPKSTFCRWVKYNMAPDVFTAYDISTALGTTLDYLITGEDRKSEKIRMEQTESRKSTEAEIKKLVGLLQNEIMNF